MGELVPHQSPGLVDSNNLIFFLGGDPGLWEPNQRFAPVLDLSYLTPALVEMNEQKVMGDIFDEQQKEELLADFPLPVLPSDNLAPEIDETLKFLSDKYVERVRAHGIVECSRVFYFDHDTKEFEVSDIILGTYSSVASPLADFIDTSKLPLLDIHTHPGNGLPSAIDYLPIITKAYIGLEYPSLTHGIVVVGPDIQFLALGTKLTPVFDVDTAVQICNEYDERTEEEKTRIDSLKKRWSGVLRALPDCIIPMWIEHINALPENERDTWADRAIQGASDEELYGEKISRYMRRRTEILERAEYKYMSYFLSSANRRLIEFPRLMNIRLYSSTDFRNFREFSA